MGRKIGRWLALVVAGLLGSAALAGSVLAQTVIIRATEAETRRPVAGAIIRLVDSAARAVAQGLTSESGRLVLRAPAPGEYLLRADRIGHAGTWSEPFTVRDTITVAVVMPIDRVLLPELTVSGSTTCEPRADGAETAALWEEIRKALTAEVITARSQEIELAVRRFRQQRSLAGVLETDTTVGLFRTTVSPFVSPPPERLEKEGYIHREGGGYQFHGPDAATLLSARFLATHCYSTAPARPGDSTVVGLAFAPVPGLKRADVRGVLWLDRASHELRTLEFEYLNVPNAVRAPGIGGRIEFERLETGAWIIRDWHIRAPRRTGLVRRVGRATAVRDTLVGYLDQGGTARRATDATLALSEAAARVRQGAAVFGDLQARLVDPEGRPVAGARVAVADLDSIYSSDQDGRVEIKDLPVGRRGVRIRAIGFRPLGVALTLSASARGVDTTLVLDRAAQLLDSVVVTARPAPFIAGKMIDVDRRRQAGFGKFLTRVELADPNRGSLEQQLRRFARVRLITLCNGIGSVAASHDRGGAEVDFGCGSACLLSVYLDGVPLWTPDMAGMPPPDLSQFHPQNLEAVEVYPSAAVIPIEFTGRLAPCGVLLIWTRVGGRQ